MKKILVFILIVCNMCLIGTMVACNNSTNNSSDINSQINDLSNNEPELTEDELESIAYRELYDSLAYKVRSSDWNGYIDPSSCRVSKGSVKNSDYSYEINGICYFYDKYGSMVSKYRDGSGGYSESFTVEVSKATGSASVEWN